MWTWGGLIFKVACTPVSRRRLTKTKTWVMVRTGVSPSFRVGVSFRAILLCLNLNWVLHAYFASLASKHIPSWQGFCNRMAYSKVSSLDLTTLDSYTTGPPEHAMSGTAPGSHWSVSGRGLDSWKGAASTLGLTHIFVPSSICQWKK